MHIDFQHVQTVFQAVVDLPVAERESALEHACRGEAELRRQVEALLKAHDDSGELPAAISRTGSYVPATVEPGEIFAGRYKLREKLGEGGMGAVFVADQTEPVTRRVALKIIKTGVESARSLARFEQERQALALMDHPNIAKVFDAGVDIAGRPYFAMELVKGLSLTKYCDEAKLSPKQRLELFVPICQAVQHAHQKGIIHRDLKPSNILVGLYDGRPVPKVIDFGVAKATGPRLTNQSIYTEVGSLNAANDLGALFREAGRSAEAIDTFQKILDALAKKKEWDQQKLSIEVIQCNLANAYTAAREPDKAIPLYKKAIDARTKTHGADDETTLKFVHSLADANFKSGRYAEAIPLLERIRDVQVKRGDSDTEDGLNVQFNLAVLYRVSGRPADGIPLLERIHAIEVKRYSADHPKAVNVLAELANAYCDAKQGEKGLAAFRQIFGSQRKIVDTDKPFWAANLAKASLKLLSCGQYTGAEEFLRECLGVSEKQEPDEWTTFYRQSMLGAALMGQAKYADSEPLLLKGYAGLKQREKSIPKDVPTRIPEALERLIELYTATNKPEEAKAYRELLAQYKDRAPPPRQVK
jgi:tetratricopeptide (TPR) repeat protein